MQYHYSVREVQYDRKTSLTAQSDQYGNIKFLTVTITVREGEKLHGGYLPFKWKN